MALVMIAAWMVAATPTSSSAGRLANECVELHREARRQDRTRLYGAAMRCYQQLLRDHGDHPNIAYFDMWFWYAEVLYKLRHFEAARFAYRQAFLRNPTGKWAWASRLEEARSLDEIWQRRAEGQGRRQALDDAIESFDELLHDVDAGTLKADDGNEVTRLRRYRERLRRQLRR